MNDDTTMDQDDMAADWGDALQEQAQVEEAAADQTAKSAAAPAALEDLEEEKQSGKRDIDLESIVDIPVTLAMEIGRTRLTIRNLLQLNQGSIVELDRLAGEPLDVLVNGTLIAHGEVVVVNEKFGVRLTDVISPQERVAKL
ncbi:MAG: flagellar motor switch protein FliN [Gammaproteobacteria bacterium]|nr:flagellar motor switch protein FliN [Gammaproteobacteria bacterium]